MFSLLCVCRFHTTIHLRSRICHILHLENIERQREKLIEIIESEFGLLEKLLKFGAIIYPKYEQIHCDTNRRKVNAMILEDISQRNTHREFIAALMESSQTHVVNWILSNGGMKYSYPQVAYCNG